VRSRKQDQAHHAQWIVFALLIAFGIAGRLLQPMWNFTPLAAIAIFGGYYFKNRLLALLAPLLAMGASNLLLPAYDNGPVMAVVYGMFLLPVALGWRLRHEQSHARLALSGMVPATLFYLTTNFAVWMFTASYQPSFGGLLTCYAFGLPFYLKMLLGDMFYLCALFGAYAVVEQRWSEGAWAAVPGQVQGHAQQP